MKLARCARYDMQPAALVALMLVGVKGDAGGTSVRDDSNQLVPILEALPLGQVDIRNRHAALGAGGVHEAVTVGRTHEAL